MCMLREALVLVVLEISQIIIMHHQRLMIIIWRRRECQTDVHASGKLIQRVMRLECLETLILY